jgi:hypothetical protein
MTRVNQNKSDEVCSMKSTQAMRDRIRELMNREQDDYDRAVECVLDDLEGFLIPAQSMTDCGGLLVKSEAAFEFIRLKLINCLEEPLRQAFWKAVEARDALRTSPAPSSWQPIGSDLAPTAWVVDGPQPLDSSEVFLTHEKALEAFNDWGKRITPLYALPSTERAGDAK